MRAKDFLRNSLLGPFQELLRLHRMPQLQNIFDKVDPYQLDEYNALICQKSWTIEKHLTFECKFAKTFDRPKLASSKKFSIFNEVKILATEINQVRENFLVKDLFIVLQFIETNS